MSSVAEAIVDICAQSESRYGFKIARLLVSQGDFNKLRAETDWNQHVILRPGGSVLFNGVEVVVDA